MAIWILKIDQITSIWDLVIEKGLIKCNANVSFMKTDSSIKIIELNDYTIVLLIPYRQINVSSLRYKAKYCVCSKPA